MLPRRFSFALLAAAAPAAVCLVVLASACAGGGPSVDVQRDAPRGEGISFRDGPGAEPRPDVFIDVAVDGPTDGPKDVTLDSDTQSDGPMPDITTPDTTADMPPPDTTVDMPPPKCSLYSNWSCMALTSIVACTTTCTQSGTEQRITCLNSGTCLCIKGGSATGQQCTVPATGGCSVCGAAFAKPCCTF
ncbi:MAG: hypothetical protein KC503_27045 [Myxococcales bacterium]|nr:hypothetical protein [Myxococcales bacterium]